MTRESSQGLLAKHRLVISVALIVLVGVGCFSDPDINKVHCKALGSECPGGLVCKVTNEVGRCCRLDDPSCGTQPPDGALSEVGDSAIAATLAPAC